MKIIISKKIIKLTTLNSSKMTLTKNFTSEEMTASCTAKRLGLKNCPNSYVMGNLRRLCENILQPIRDEWGAPIIVGSGYRCTQLNAAVGGVVNSDHLYGCAADIKTLHDRPIDNKALFDIIRKLHAEGKLPLLKQCIDEYDYNWIHISFQDGRTAKLGQFIHLPKYKKS